MSATVKPAVTATQHVLPFQSLQPADFERFCLWLVSREGFDQVEHLGSSGRDQGCDILGIRQSERWVFQCKRVARFGPSDAIKEVDKILALPEVAWPTALVFIVTCPISSQTRQAARHRCTDKITCLFWGKTELDEKVNRHSDLLRAFFLLSDKEGSTRTESEPAIKAQDAIPKEQIEGLLVRIDQLIALQTSTTASPASKDAPVRANLLICDVFGRPVMYEYLTSNYITVGRGSDNTVRIPDSRLSSHHLRIDLRGSFLYITDLDSTNGTYVNDRRITKRSVIRFGDRISIGNHILLIYSPSEKQCHTPKTSQREGNADGAREER